MDNNPETAARILTSMMKNIDNLLYRALAAYVDGTLVLGQVEELGIAEGAVGLAYNDIYTEATPENVQALVAAVEEAVTNGDITIVTAFGDEPFAVNAGCDTMPETTFDAAELLAAE